MFCHTYCLSVGSDFSLFIVQGYLLFIVYQQHSKYVFCDFIAWSSLLNQESVDRKRLLGSNPILCHVHSSIPEVDYTIYSTALQIFGEIPKYSLEAKYIHQVNQLNGSSPTPCGYH